MSKKKPSALKREYQALHNMKFLNFSLPVPDPDSEYGSGSTDLIDIRIQSGSESATLQYTIQTSSSEAVSIAGQRGSTGLWARWMVEAASLRRMLTSCRRRPTTRRGTGADRCSTRPNPRPERGRVRRFR
jgi:hypothetical protein